MSLRLEITSRQRQSMRGSAVKEFGPDGGTIGRSLQTDWPLPDAQRFLSSHHASIDFRSGSYYIVDTSTNGVFINGATDPVGKGKPQRLFSGDTIRIGDYEIRVEIENHDNTVETLIDHDHVDPVDARQRVEAPDPTGHDLIDAFEITGVGIEFEFENGDESTLTPLAYSFDTSDIELEAEETAGVSDPDPTDTRPAAGAAARRDSAEAQRAERRRTTATKATQPKPAAAKAPPPAAATNAAAPKTAAAKSAKSAANSAAAKAASPKAAVAKPAAAEVAAPLAAKKRKPGTSAKTAPDADSSPKPPAHGALIAAFCEGAGIPASALRGDDARETFLRLGQTFRALLGGVTEALQLRSLQKARLKQPQTVIQPRDNNPLKFSANAGEALTRLLAAQTDEYLEPVTAVRDAFTDINLHQRAVLKVLPEVLARYLEQLDPDSLEQKFASAGRNRLLGAANKLRYWDLYRDVYLVMSAQAADELPEAFIDMLSAALEREIAAAKSAATAADLAQAVG